MTDRPAIRTTGRDDLSYPGLAAVLEAAAGELTVAGLGPGDTVAMFMAPSAETAVATMAVMGAACVAPLNPALPAPALASALSRVRPRLLLVSPETPRWAAEVADRLGIVVGRVAPDGTGRAGAIHLEAPSTGVRPQAGGPPGPDDPALLLQTSGSTGAPKLVPLTQRQMRAGADAVARSLGLGPADTALHTLPMHHVGGIVDLVMAPLVSGGTVAVAAPFSAPLALSALHESAPTWVQLAPTMLAELLEEAEYGGRRTTALRLIRSVSAPLPVALLDRAERSFGVPVVEIYGMTETAGVISSNPLDDRRAGTVGLPVDLELRVAGPDGSELAAGAEGEILVRGPSVFRGYLPEPGEQSEEGEQPFIDGWLRTGDVGMRDADGYLTITGRLKDAINRGGETISPAGIDRVLLEHPAVADAAAFGMPHRTLGELPAAVVVTRPGHSASPAELQAWVGERLAPVMVPRPIAIIDRIPRVGGKLRRAELPALLSTAADRPGAPAHLPADTAELMRLWADTLGLPSVEADADFFALGGDSLRGARLVARLGEMTGDIVYASAVFEAPTPARFAEHLRRHYPRSAAALAGAAPAAVRHAPVTEPLIERFRALIHQPTVHPLSAATTTRNPRAAFILSAPRSGSTLLRTMLAGHPRLFAPPELYLLAYSDLAERSRHFPPPHTSQLEGAVRALMAAEGLDAAAATRRMRDLESAGCGTAEFYRLLQQDVGDRLLVDKTPANALAVDILRRAERLFTDSVYIHLVRHPAAMTASFVEANLGSLWAPRITGPDSPAGLLDDISPAQLGELLWLVLNTNIEEFLADVPSDRVAKVRFEDLVTDPVGALAPVCEVLGVDFSPALLDPYDRSTERMTDGLHDESRMIGDPKFHRHHGIDAARGHRWRTEASAISLSNPTREVAARYGYTDPLDEAPGEDSPGGTDPGMVTAVQRRVWTLARLNPDSSVYNVPVAFRLRGELDLLALDRALTALARRHAALRASFPADPDGSPHLVIAEPAPVVAPLTDCRWLAAEHEQPAAEQEVLRITEREARLPFDLATGPLWRASVIREEDRNHLLVMAFHHIVFDGLSRTLLLGELGALYAEAVTGTAADLPPAPPYTAVLRRQSAIDAKSAGPDLDYWRERFAQPAQPLVLPADHDRPPGPGRARSVRVSLPEHLGIRVEQFCRGSGTTPAAAWLAATAALLSRWTGQQDLLVCVPTAGRHSVEAQSAIGYFNRLVPVRLDASGDPTVGAFVNHATARMVEAVDHDGTPLQDLAIMPGLARVSLSTALVSYQQLPDVPLRLTGLDVYPLPVRRDASDFDLAVHVERRPSGVDVLVDYHDGLFEEASAAGLARLLADTIERMAGNAAAPLSAIPAPGPSVAAVEAVLANHPKVDAATVVIRSGRPVAYLVLNEFDVPDLAEIEEYARAALPAYRVPTTFVPVGHLPRTAAGDIDTHALPDPLHGPRPDLSEPPRDDLEAAIAGIWRTVLWLGDDVPIGRADSFRALGGHSLLAVRMIGLLEEHLGHRLPLAAVSRLDSIAGLAESLRAAPASSLPADPAVLAPGADPVLSEDILAGLLAHTGTWSGVRHTPNAVTVGLNTAGGRPALFWCLQNNEEHEALARHLGPDQPVYGMRSGNRVMVKNDENIDALARHYIREIQEIQPHGPYLIGGNCQAARIAIRIARGLRAAGHQVPVLFMMEKFDPVGYDGAVVMMYGDRSDRNPYSRFTEPELGYRKFYRGPIWIRETPGEHGWFFVEPNVISLAATIDEHLWAVAGRDCLPAPNSPAGTALAPLGSGAYRAAVRLVRPTGGGPEVPGEVEVAVTNVSAEDWPDGSTGGIALGWRWLDPGSGSRTLGGIVPLPTPTPAGATVRMTLPVAEPPGDGLLLEVDVLEQGVTWFGDLGSTPLRVGATLAGSSTTTAAPIGGP